MVHKVHKYVKHVTLGPHSAFVASLIADPIVVSSKPAQPHTSMDFDHAIFSTVILLLLIQGGLWSVASESTCMCTNFWLTALSRKYVIRPTDRFNMTIAVDCDVYKKTTSQTNKTEHLDILKTYHNYPKILTSHSNYLIMYLY